MKTFCVNKPIDVAVVWMLFIQPFLGEIVSLQILPPPSAVFPELHM